MTNLSPRKIQIYPGINDAPIAPSTIKGGNGSHLISKFNSLIDDLQIALDNIKNTGATLTNITTLEQTIVGLRSRIQVLEQNIIVLASVQMVEELGVAIEQLDIRITSIENATPP